MKFLRKFVIVCMSGDFGKAFFNTKTDAVEYLGFLQKKYPYSTFKLFEEVVT